jgi:hypothetical protein
LFFKYLTISIHKNQQQNRQFSVPEGGLADPPYGGRELGFRGIPILNAALAAISNERGEVIVPTGRIPHLMRDVGTKNQYFFAAPIFNCENSIRVRRTVDLSNQR